MQFIAPRYWLLWVVVFWLRIMCRLPYRFLMHLGAWLGKLLVKFPSRARQVTWQNITLCFPNLSLQEQQQLLTANFCSLGMGIFETALSYWGTPKQLGGLLHIQGLEHLKAAKQQGKGALVLGAHFATLQLIGRLMSSHIEFAVVYRRQKNPLLNYFTQLLVKKYYQAAIPRGDLRGILQCLQRNCVVWYTPDVDAGRKNSVFVPFFNIEAASITATPRLAKLSGAPVFICAYYRRDDLSGYDVIIEPVLANFPSDTIVADVQRINQAQERIIRLKPEQYLWQYKRFKTRPPSEPKLYN